MAITDLEIFPRKQCSEIFLAVTQEARRAGITEVEVMFNAGEEALTRFANNAIHQNVAERSVTVSVRVIADGRTARATTNRIHRDGIRAVVEEAIALARSSEMDPGLLPLYSDTAELDGGRWDASVAEATPELRGRGVAEALDAVRSTGQIAAGIYATGSSVEAVLNSTGLFRYYGETLAQFSITAMASDSSGWAKATATHLGDIRPVALAEQAARKAALSRAPRQIKPGRFTVLLEPAAVLDLVGQMFGDFSATALADQRSFLNDRLGQALFGENINIYDHAGCPLQNGPPFDGEGVPRQMLTLVENGRPKQVAASRAIAAQQGTAPSGHGFPLPNDSGEAPLNIVIRGGRATVEELLASINSGVLVTRLWYIREVEPYAKAMTGMTRDGTFLIEDGEIVCGLRNLRFNQSLVEMLCNVEALGQSVRSSGEEAFDMVVPAMRVSDFNFTEVTRF